VRNRSSRRSPSEGKSAGTHTTANQTRFLDILHDAVLDAPAEHKTTHNIPGGRIAISREWLKMCCTSKGWLEDDGMSGSRDEAERRQRRHFPQGTAWAVRASVSAGAQAPQGVSKTPCVPALLAVPRSRRCLACLSAPPAARPPARAGPRGGDAAAERVDSEQFRSAPRTCGRFRGILSLR